MPGLNLDPQHYWTSNQCMQASVTYIEFCKDVGLISAMRHNLYPVSILGLHVHPTELAQCLCQDILHIYYRLASA